MDPHQPYAQNLARQKDIYGATLNTLIHRITGALDITQARLAETIGVSPAMLSQLSGGRRVKIGDPYVISRLFALDQRCQTGPISADDVPDLLAEIQASTPLPFVARPAWPPHAEPGRGPRAVNVPGTNAPRAEDAFRHVPRSRLGAAAATIDASFPEIAALFRRAASSPPRRA